MNPSINRFPGKAAFVKRHPRFVTPRASVADPAKMILGRLRLQIRNGDMAPGDQVPSPARLAAISGASLPACLEAVTSLLEMGLVDQRVDGNLFVAKAR